jgi:hypothetical protein
MLVRMVEHLCIRYILDQPPIDRERFIDETTAMALNYLRRRAGEPKSSARPRN